VAGFAGGFATRAATAATESAPVKYPFYGTHQAGIATPAQDRLHFATFDVTTTDREELVTLLRAWSTAAARMMAGLPAGEQESSYDAPPADTGEADGLPPSGLTITIGFGPGLFRDVTGKDRFGIADRAPEALRTLPHFPGDHLDPERCGGDLCVQACADDPQVAVHAVRNLARIGFGTVSLRWSQLGFGRTSSTSKSQATPRNLFGFKDGTANLKAENPALLDEHVWVAPGDDPRADWLAGGSYLVARRINMQIETWDRTSLREQETNIGRDRAEGAPLSGGTEFTPADFSIKGSGGLPIIDARSHVRLAHPSTNGGVQMLRRGYNFTDGSNSLGRIDAGLFFIAFVRNPDTHYIPMQTRLAKDDRLSEYLQHTGSGLFAVPPAATEGSYLAASLFDAR
jgi:deferrochelatase/peroxidase EfeB